MVIMAQSTSRPEEDFWDKTYALLTGEYMNYNSRLGYHYTSVDAYVSDNPGNNHIRFMFKGGAADELRRARRARFIGAVLEHMGFEVVVHKDEVNARFLHYDRSDTENNLDLIGRLMGCSRQRDMVMNDEAIASWHIEAFLRGNYGFDPAK
jgi:pyruvate,water dikinase